MAGTRSFDINMPKEINRLVIDGLSDLLFTASDSAGSIVQREGSSLSKVYMVGNILIDTLRASRERWRRPSCLDGIDDGRYLVLTINQPALLNNEAWLQQMSKAISCSVGNVRVIVPTRNDTLARKLSEVNTQSSTPTFIMQPTMDMLEFGYLTAHALGIITDSANIAEEATFSGVPCITLATYTEHIETVKEGSNVLVGDDINALTTQTQHMINGEWKHSTIPDRWDGRSAERIINILLSA